MVEIRKLKCGARAAMEQIEGAQSVSIGIWVHAGSAFENAGNSGISHFIEHMMFKGTETRSALDLASETDAMGSQMNAFTGKEATCYYIKSLKSNAEKSLSILLDMFTASVFDEEEMERERKVIFEEMKMIKDSPDEECVEMISAQVFRGTPLGRSIIGTASSLGGIRRSTIMNYLKKQYTMDSVVVSIAGSFDEDTLCDMIETAFSGYEKSKSGYSYEMPETMPSYRVKVRDIEQSHICLATKSVPFDHDDIYKINLLSNILGGSMSSRLFQNIRERKGLAYTVYSINSSFEHDGYFNIYAGISHDRIKEAAGGIREELEKAGEEGFTEEELSKAKEQMKSGFIFGLESVNARMYRIGKEVIRSGEVKTQEEILGAIDAVTLKDLETVSERYCDIGNYSASLVTARKTGLRRIISG